MKQNLPGRENTFYNINNIIVINHPKRYPRGSENDLTFFITIGQIKYGHYFQLAVSVYSPATARVRNSLRK